MSGRREVCNILHVMSGRREGGITTYIANFCILCFFDLSIDLSCMYKLFSRVEGGLACMVRCMSGHLRETGKGSLTLYSYCFQFFFYVCPSFDLQVRMLFTCIKSYSNTSLTRYSPSISSIPFSFVLYYISWYYVFSFTSQLICSVNIVLIEYN